MQPPTFTWKVADGDTVMGSPAHVPNHHRTGDPAVSQISAPTIDQFDPLPFVHEITDVGPVACPDDAELNVIDATEDPVPLRGVPALVAVGAVVVRFSVIGGDGAPVPVHVVVPSVTFSSLFACAWTIAEIATTPKCRVQDEWRRDNDFRVTHARFPE